MTIERKTVIDQIEITRTGFVQVRFGLLLVEDGEEIDCKYHRVALGSDADVDATFALVNTQLSAKGLLPVPTDALAKVKAYMALSIDLGMAKPQAKGE